MSSQIQIGLSLPDWQAPLADYPDIPECFEILELPGALLPAPDAAEEKIAEWSDYLAEQDFHRIRLRNLLPSPLMRQLSDAPDTIWKEFKLQLRTLIQFSAEFNTSVCSLDPDLEALVSGERIALQQKFYQLFGAIAGDLSAAEQTLELPLRLPSGNSLLPTDILSAFYRLGNHRVRLSLDVYVHEILGREPDYAKLLRTLRFELNTIRICYETELGNQLQLQHVNQLRNALQQFGMPFTVLLAPSGRCDLNQLADLAMQLSTPPASHAELPGEGGAQ